jgi:hypothetical protein
VKTSALPELSGVGRAALAAAALGVAASIAGAWIDPAQFFRSYLVAFLYVAGLSMGCLGILMIYHLTGGSWGVAIRRVLEAGAGAFPLVALLFVPLLFGLPHLYPWRSQAVMAASEALRVKTAYLNVPAFIARAAVYFAAWIALSFLLLRWSKGQDEEADPRSEVRMRKLSGGGIVLFGFTVTFAAFDWVMSLDPTWSSTIFGLLFIGEQGLGGMAFAILVAYFLSRRAEYARALKPTVLNDLGNLLLAFVMVWAYLSFSQILIIWAGNLPEEIPWFLRRIAGGWNLVAIGLAVFYFAVPFLVLLGRGNKRQHRRLAAVAAGILVVRAVDLYYLAAPEFHPAGITAHWLDVATVVGLGGIWMTAVLRRLAARPLLAPNDPVLPGTLARIH